jgi:hypothetical protein
MHSLSYLLGESVFFPILKKLATDEKYTYNHFVTTDDVEQLFSKESGKNLKPFLISIFGQLINSNLKLFTVR